MIHDRGDGFVDMIEEDMVRLFTSGKPFACSKCCGLGFLDTKSHKCTHCGFGRVGSLYVMSKTEAIDRGWEPE